MSQGYIPTKFSTRCTNINERLSRTPDNIKKMAEGLLRYLIDNELFFDTRVYYHYKNQWFCCQDEAREYSYCRSKNISFEKVEHNHNGKIYTWYICPLDPNDFFDYNGEYLSVSTEGRLYHLLNEGWDEDWRTRSRLNNYFSYWGLYYELGNAWNFSLYNI